MIRLLVAIWILLASPLLMAQDNNQSDQEQGASRVTQEKLEDVMFNNTHQFIYAFFGKDLLLYYLDEDIEINLVKAASDQELRALSQPFNSVYNQFFLMGMTAIYFITVAYFMFKLTLFSSENIWLMQRKSTGTMSGEELKAMTLKLVLLGAIVLIPMKMEDDRGGEYYTNPAMLALFSFMGEIHQFSDNAMGELIAGQKTVVWTVKLPSSGAKWSSGIALNEFFTCVKFQRGRQQSGEYNENIDIYLMPNNTMQGAAVVGDCELTVQMGINTVSDKFIADILSIDPTIDLQPGIFEDLQLEMMKSLLSVVFKDAKENAEKLSQMSESIVSSWSDFELSNFTALDGVGQADFLANWPSKCDKVREWEANIGLKNEDRQFYHLLTSRCLSHKMARALIFPDSQEVLNDFLSNNQSRRKEIAFCVDKASYAGTIANRRFSPVYSESGEDDFGSVSLKSCLATICSRESIMSGGSFACANTIENYNRVLSDQAALKRGSLIVGFYIYNLFAQQVPSDESKAMFNKLEFQFERSQNLDPVTPFDGQKIGSIPTLMGSVVDHAYQVDVVMNQLRQSGGMKFGESIGNETGNIRKMMFSYAESFGVLAIEMTGMDRLAACVQNPLQIVDDFICNNIPRELSGFGNALIENALAAKTMLIMGGAIRDFTSMGGNTTGKLTGRQSSEKAFSLIAISGLLESFGELGNVADDISESLAYSANYSSDEFGFLDTEKQVAILENSFLASIIIGAEMYNANSFISLINTIINLCLLVGIFFAFVVPLLPIFLIVKALVTFLFLLMKVIVMTGFKLTDACFDKSADLLSDNVEGVIADWLALSLKIPLTVVGVILAWFMSNVIISGVMKGMDITVATNDVTMGIIDMMVMFIVSGVVIFVVYQSIIGIINTFYSFTVDWILGDMTNSPFDDERGFGLDEANEVKSIAYGSK